MILAEAPGKLYVLGEYAVVEPGRHAVLVAVDRTVRVRVEQADDAGLLHADHAEAGAPLAWRHGEQAVEFGPDATGFYRYLRAAVAVVEELRRQRGLPPEHYALRAVSGLDDAASGAKFGLGSSAAATVAAVAGVAAHYGLGLSPEEHYRLGMLATLRVTGSTSGGDVAASALGGWVHYASPDRTWLAREAASRTTADLLEAEWPGLVLERLDQHGKVPGGGLPAALEMRVGWTGAPADTPHLVDRVRRRAALPADLLERSDAAVADFLAAAAGASSATGSGLGDAGSADPSEAPDTVPGAPGAPNGGVEGVGRALERGRDVLAELAELRGTVIETPELARLVRAARATGWWAKSSGAGGGDCGIALAPAGTPAEALEAAWREVGIRPLELGVAARGATATAPTDSTTETSSTASTEGTRP